jgi:NAD(P)-dependent dehydrogenase (short-subunit alcohol dehydrogenase family)
MTDVAVVTGTSTGMGLWAAVELARRGLTVVATMRDTSRAGPLREAAIAGAATSPGYRFRWHTSEQAAAFAGLSLADLDGERVLGVTRTWVS